MIISAITKTGNRYRIDWAVCDITNWYRFTTSWTANNNILYTLPIAVNQVGSYESLWSWVWYNGTTDFQTMIDLNAWISSQIRISRYDNANHSLSSNQDFRSRMSYRI
jgi:hypothetical protein